MDGTRCSSKSRKGRIANAKCDASNCVPRISQRSSGMKSPPRTGGAEVGAGRAEILPSLLSEVQSACQPLWNTSAACSWSSAGQKQVREAEQMSRCTRAHTHVFTQARTHTHTRVHTSTHTLEYIKKKGQKENSHPASFPVSALIHPSVGQMGVCSGVGVCVCLRMCIVKLEPHRAPPPHTHWLLIRAAQKAVSSRTKHKRQRNPAAVPQFVHELR